MATGTRGVGAQASSIPGGFVIIVVEEAGDRSHVDPVGVLVDDPVADAVAWFENDPELEIVGRTNPSQLTGSGQPSVGAAGVPQDREVGQPFDRCPVVGVHRAAAQ